MAGVDGADRAAAQREAAVVGEAGDREAAGGGAAERLGHGEGAVDELRGRVEEGDGDAVAGEPA